MGNLIPSNNNDDNLDFNPTKLPGCKIWLDASDESTLFSTDYQGSITVPDNFIPTSISGCATWFDSSDASTLYNTSAGPVTAVSSPTEVSGCALWLDASDASTLYKTDAAAAIPVNSPLDIGGCVGWWDATDTSTMFQNTNGTSPVTTDGQLVGSWVDKATGKVATAPGNNNRPTYRTSVVNNKSSLLFDGWDDYFSVLNMPSQTNETVFIVTRANFQESKTHVLIGDQNPTGYGITLYTSAAVNRIRGSYGGYTPGLTGFIYDMPGNSNIDPVLICARRNSSGASLREAGTDIQSSTTQFTLAYRYMGADPGTASVGTASNNVLNGHICEIIIYSSDLSDSDRAKVESYLATKWGIQRTFDLAAAGSGVGSWKDKSGNSKHAIQPSSTNRPIRSGSQNGLGVITLDGIDDTLTSPLQDSNTQTIFWIAKTTGLSDYSLLLSYNGSNGNRTVSVGNGGFWKWYGPNLTSTQQTSSYSVMSATVYSDTLIALYQSGWQVGTADPTNQFNFSPNNLMIGSTGIHPFKGEVAEIIIYNRALSSSERCRVEKYLDLKWNLGGIHLPASLGGPIGYWGDKSGNNKHATQEIGSYRPSYTGTINSLPAITFDGTDDHFLIDNLSSLFPNFGEVFIVFEPNNAATYEIYQTAGNYSIYRYAGGSYLGAFTSTRATVNTPYQISIAAPTTGVHVTAMRANSSSMTARLDGSVWYTATGFGYSSGASHSIGYSGQGTGGVGGIVMNGKIVEIITYNTDIGAENRAKVEQYLAKKWGISNSLHGKTSLTSDRIGYAQNKGSLNTCFFQIDYYNRPRLGTLNGKKALDFTRSSANSYLQTPYQALNSTAWSFFIVYRTNSTNTTVYTYGVQDGLRLISRFPSNTVTYGGTNTVFYARPLPINTTMVESLIKGSGGTGVNQTILYRYGVNCVGTGTSGAGTEANTSEGWFVLNGYNSPYTGQGYNTSIIGEFIVYDRALSNPERILVESYLYNKWKIDETYSTISAPTDIRGCSLWLDANDVKTLFQDVNATTLISANNQSVAYWADKVGGQDVIQSTLSARPTYRTSIQNGKPMIYFDGSDDLLSQINRPYVAPCTLFVVCRIDSHSGDLPGIFTHGDNTGGLSGPGFIYNGSPGIVILDGSGAGGTNSSNTAATVLGLPRIITGIYTQSNTSNSSLYVNGNLEENFTGTGVALSATANRVQIGARTGGGQSSRRMIGYVAECIRYDRILTDNERAMVENYLSEKWGIGSHSSPNSIGSAIVRHKIKVSNRDAQNWVDRVFANGGSVSEKTADAVDKFCKEIESAGLRKKFYRLNLFCGNDLQACLTPLYLGPDSNRFYGFRAEQNTGFFQNNYDEKNGLIAGPGSATGGNGIYLLTGVSLSDMGLSDTGHMAFYQTQFNIDTNPYTAINRPIIGAGNTYISLQASNSVQSYYGGFNAIESSYFGGLYVLTRNSSSDMKSYEAGNLLGTQTASISIPDQTSSVGIFTSTNGSAAAGNNYYFGYVKGYSVGQSMTEQEVFQYNTIMETFQNTLGRGLPVRASAQFTSVNNEETKSWIDAVYANGGTVSAATALAVNNFTNSVQLAGLRNKFYRLNLFCGNDLAACLVPLYRGPNRLGTRYGNAKDLNISFDGYGSYVNSDNFNYIENQGLLGNTQDISGNSFVSRRLLNTGFIAGSVTALNNNMHVSAYSKVLSSGGYPMGTYEGTGTGFSLQIGIKGYNLGAFANSLLNTTNTSTPVIYPSNKGLYVGNYSNNILTMYEGRASTVGQRDLTTIYALNPASVSPIGLFAEWRQGNGIGLFNYLDRLQGYSIGASMSSSDVQSYYDIMQTFQASLSRANEDPVLGSEFSSITNLDTRDWLTRVYKNGGTVSVATATAVQNFCDSIDSAGLRNRFFRLNLFCGNDLNSCAVPLYRGPSRTGTQRGFLYDINNNFISADYEENSGLKGNGSNKYLETGLEMTFLGTNQLHMFCSFVPDTFGVTALLAARLNLSGSLAMETNYQSINNRPRLAWFGIGLQPDDNVSPTIGRTQYLCNYDGSGNTLVLGRNISLNYPYVPGSYSSTNTTPFYVFAGDQTGTGIIGYSPHRIDAYSIGAAFTSVAQRTAFHNAMSDFRAALGRT